MRTYRTAICFFILSGAVCLPEAMSQGYGDPLRMQGLHHRSVSSAAARGAGGISLGLNADPSLMFANPSSLQQIGGLHISVGGLTGERRLEQSQRWLPLRNFPTFSLMMEGLIDQIDDPDLSDPPPGGLGPEDSIPRPYDVIKPNWTMKQPARRAFQAYAAMPFELGGLKIVGGIGAVQYANLDYYFQNNNVLSPSIGTQRPVGIPLPGIGEEVLVDWAQYIQQREGAIIGYGGAVSIGITEEISVGASGLLLDGSSDDYEAIVGRGLIHFGNNNNVFYHTLDSVYSRKTVTGTSEYSGHEFSLSAMYKGENISLGLIVRPPSSVSRSFTAAVEIDTTGNPAPSTTSGSDRMLLPWRGVAGIAFAMRDDLSFGFEYEIRPLASSEYTDPAGETTSPWLSSSIFRVGGEFVPTGWLTVRAGYREEAEVFEQVGNPISGEPVRFSVYSAGIGLRFFGVGLNVAYEYSHLKYQDMWQTNVNINNVRQSAIIVDLSYVIH